MSSVKAVPSYNDVYDFSYRLVSNNIDQIQSHIEFLIYRGASQFQEKNVTELLNRLIDIQSLFENFLGNNNSNSYVQFESYEYVIHPNDMARIFLRGEDKGMDKIIIKDTFSPEKKNALEQLIEFFDSGELELFQTDVEYEPLTQMSIEQLRQQLSVLPVSLADVVLQERRENN